MQSSGDILLGYDLDEVAHSSFGFGANVLAKRPSAGAPVFEQNEHHLITCATTGAGKGRGQIIPALLSYSGSVICIDPKGENYRVTANYRRSNLGQEVFALDPFGVLGNKNEAARLDPLDCLVLPGVSLEPDAENMAEMIFPAGRDPKHIFWDSLARTLMAGLFIHGASMGTGINGAYSLLTGDDFDYGLAVELDKGLVKSTYAYKAFTQYLALGSGGNNNNVRPDTLATARSFMNFMASNSIQASMLGSTLKLSDIIAAKPLTIYLVLPVEYLESHARVLKLWLSCLMRALWLRRSAPEMATLILCDEAACLGGMPQLQQALTTLRGFGARVWLFYQSLTQIKSAFPHSWQTMLDNATLTTFGFRNYRTAQEIGDLLGVDPMVLLRMPPDHLAVARREGGVHILRRPDYLHDPNLSSRASANTFYQTPSSGRAA